MTRIPLSWPSHCPCVTLLLRHTATAVAHTWLHRKSGDCSIHCHGRHMAHASHGNCGSAHMANYTATAVTVISIQGMRSSQVGKAGSFKHTNHHQYFANSQLLSHILLMISGISLSCALDENGTSFLGSSTQGNTIFIFWVSR